MDFGNRLKIIREEKNIKREDLASKIGTSAAIIGRYERNERRDDFLIRLCLFLE